MHLRVVVDVVDIVALEGWGVVAIVAAGTGWVVVEGAVGSNNLNRDGVGDGEGNGDGGDSGRGTNHAAAGTRDGVLGH